MNSHFGERNRERIGPKESPPSDQGEEALREVATREEAVEEGAEITSEAAGQGRD